MLLIQFQEHSVPAVSCPFAPYRRNRRRAYIRRHPRMCMHIQGFINWIMPDEMFVRDASGYPRGERPFKTTLLALFRPASCSFVSLHPAVSPSSLSSLLPFASPFSRDPAPFAETGYGNWRTRESRSPLFVPRTPTRPILVSNSSHVSDPEDKTLRSRDRARSAPAR